MVLLIGNYRPDQQQSMQRFASMMLHGLIAAGVDAELIEPKSLLGNFRLAGSFVAKWLAYLDKFILFPRQLRRRLRSAPAPSIVHICDHSNSPYAKAVRTSPLVVTCHDLLAVRGALGEETDSPASRTGKILQRWILSGLRRARTIVCVSRSTLRDAEKFIPEAAGTGRFEHIPVGLNFPYRKLAPAIVDARLAAVRELDLARPFLLHVGSNLRRKNRDGVLRIFARYAKNCNAQMVFAGDALSPELCGIARSLGIAGEIIEVPAPANEMLEALYNRATALIFPSRFEGFGWPVIEAQACGCPIVCSNAGPLPEVAGDAALLFDVQDEEGFARGVAQLSDEEERDRWSARSLANARRFTAGEMITRYIEVYRGLAPEL
ncbi:MAG: glycosyltransferase family 1 protein [Chthoniobacterales bacterium]